MALRLVVMGTGPFAVPMFQALLGSNHQIAALVTRPAASGRRQPASPMRLVAQQHELPILEPKDINSQTSREELAPLAPDLLIVCDYGQILSSESLAIARFGGINLHASLLPKYRGAAPINWALYRGESQTGVTVIQMTSKLDAGPALVQRSLKIDPQDTAVELEEKLARFGVEPVLESIEILSGNKDSTPGAKQDPQLATRAPRLKKNDGQVDWSRSARQISDQVRAFEPWPRTFSHWLRPSTDPLRLILDHVRVAEDVQITRSAGEVEIAQGNRMVLATGDGPLQIVRIQPAGKRVMSAEDFLRGYAIQEGDRFGQ